MAIDQRYADFIKALDLLLFVVGVGLVPNQIDDLENDRKLENDELDVPHRLQKQDV